MTQVEDPSQQAKDAKRQTETASSNPDTSTDWPQKFEHIQARLRVIYRQIVDNDRLAHRVLAEVQPAYRRSAQNLLHYLVLRQQDLRPLQMELASLGLSSISNVEPCVKRSIEAILWVLQRLTGDGGELSGDAIDYEAAAQLLQQRTRALLGETPPHRAVRIMVTMPREAADDAPFVETLLTNGMQCMRINCAKDSPAVWSAMIANLRQAERALGKHCKVAMDLAGPKLRTRLDDGERLDVQLGERVIIHRDATATGRAPRRNDAGELTHPGHIGCTLPQAFTHAHCGQKVWFDDGKIGAVIASVEETTIGIDITHVRPGGDHIKTDKGINLPDTRFELSALTEKDLEDLAFVADHADIVSLSFVNSAADVKALHKRLQALGTKQPGIILKIETQASIQNLPEILLAAMQWPSCGVMIARGDLAVEVGFERLAEVQEEILWFCEAAHMPVIWGTQVLESLAKKGAPSRAEITDAAMGHRAECVMLNKGPNILQAVAMLDDILRRMEAHQSKKRSMLRALNIAKALPRALDASIGEDNRLELQ